MSASGSESKVRCGSCSYRSFCADIVPQSTLELIRRSMRNEGPMFMLKGWVPAWMRLQPTTMLIFITFEQLKNLVDWTREYRGDA